MDSITKNDLEDLLQSIEHGDRGIRLPQLRKSVLGPRWNWHSFHYLPIVKEVFTFIEEFLDRVPCNLYIQGRTGIGKTWALYYSALKLWVKDKFVIYVNFKKTHSPDPEKAFYKEILMSMVLFNDRPLKDANINQKTSTLLVQRLGEELAGKVRNVADGDHLTAAELMSLYNQVLLKFVDVDPTDVPVLIMDEVQAFIRMQSQEHQKKLLVHFGTSNMMADVANGRSIFCTSAEFVFSQLALESDLMTKLHLKPDEEDASTGVAAEFIRRSVANQEFPDTKVKRLVKCATKISRGTLKFMFSALQKLFEDKEVVINTGLDEMPSLYMDAYTMIVSEYACREEQRQLDAAKGSTWHLSDAVKICRNVYEGSCMRDPGFPSMLKGLAYCSGRGKYVFVNHVIQTEAECMLFNVASLKVGYTWEPDMLPEFRVFCQLWRNGIAVKVGADVFYYCRDGGSNLVSLKVEPPTMPFRMNCTYTPNKMDPQPSDDFLVNFQSGDDIKDWLRYVGLRAYCKATVFLFFGLHFKVR